MFPSVSLVPDDGTGADAAATMPLSTDVLTSLSLDTMAEGVSGGVRSSKDNVVVCDLRRVVVVLRVSRGFVGGLLDDEDFSEVWDLFVGVSEDWKWVRRVCVDFVMSMRVRMSGAGLEDLGGGIIVIRRYVS